MVVKGKYRTFTVYALHSVCVYVPGDKYLYTHGNNYTHRCMHARTHAHAHTHTHTLIHMHTQHTQT